MITPETEPYEALAGLIETELMLVGERRLDELPSLKERRRALERTLPAVPPSGARDVLQRCLLLNKRVEIEMLRVREAMLAELAQMRRAQRAARGYATPRVRPPHLIASA